MELMGRKMRARASSLSESTAQDGPSHAMALSQKLRKLKAFSPGGKSPLFSLAQDSGSCSKPPPPLERNTVSAEHQVLCMHHILKSQKILIFPTPV